MDAPATGERVDRLLALRNLVVEQILSGADDEPRSSVQDQDEWVVLLDGAAVLDVDGDRLDLGPGDWAFLPARVPHTVVRTEAGTSWLAVHLHPDGGGAQPARSRAASGSSPSIGSTGGCPRS